MQPNLFKENKHKKTNKNIDSNQKIRSNSMNRSVLTYVQSWVKLRGTKNQLRQLRYPTKSQ